jgi:hypothetical protein
MSLLYEVKPPPLEAGECVVGQWVGDHLQGTNIQRGIVSLTNRRIAFEPTRLGWVVKAVQVLGGMWSTTAKPWSVPLSGVADVTVLEPTTRLREKGLPLTLLLKSGKAEEFFFVHEYADTEAKIRNAIAPTG